MEEKKEKKAAPKKTTAKKETTKKTVAKKTTKKKVSPKKVEKKEVVEEVNSVELKVEETKPVEVKAEEITETKIEPAVEEKKEEIKAETKAEQESIKKIPFVTIALAVVAVVLAILLVVNSGTKTDVELNTLLPDVFGENEVNIKLPKGFMIADSGELFEKQDGMLITKGFVSGALYTEEEFTEMKEAFVESYGAIEVEVEGYQAINVQQAYDTDIYNYYFLYKDGIMMQLVTLNCTDSQVDTLLNGVNF